MSEANDYIAGTEFVVFWGHFPDDANKEYNFILLNPSKAEVNNATGQGKGYFTYLAEAYEDEESLCFRKGERFKLQLPIDSFAKYLHKKIMYKGWDNQPVLLSFKKINAKNNDFEIAPFDLNEY